MRRAAPEFEKVVIQVLEANDFVIEQVSGLEFAFDFSAYLAGESWAVEVKYYRTSRPQPSLIEAATANLIKSAALAQFEKAILIVSCHIDPELRRTLENSFGITLIDRTDLAIWARVEPKLADELERYIDGPNLSAGAAHHPKEISTLKISSAAPTVVVSRGGGLCRKLQNLQRGRDHWRQYELLCADILKYLFENSLNGWHEQKRTDDGLNRFDLICRVSPNTEFWQFVDSRLGSRYVLFEFKNYVGKIKQGQMLTTEKYLLNQGLRKVCFVLCRKGADAGANQVAVGAMRYEGKLMLVLDDKMVCDLLHAKDQGDDPGDVLFDYADDFLMTLSR